MKRSDVCKIALFAGWFTALGVFFILGTLQLRAAPAPCIACTCRNVKVYQAFGAAPDGPKAFWKRQPDNTWDVTTQAFASCQTKNACDDPSIVQTTETIVPKADVATPNCTYSTPPPGQTIYVECQSTALVPPVGNPQGITRYVCAPP